MLQSRSPAILAGTGARRFSICSTIHIWLRLLSTIFPKWWPLTALINGFEATILYFSIIQLEPRAKAEAGTEQNRLGLLSDTGAFCFASQQLGNSQLWVKITFKKKWTMGYLHFRQSRICPPPSPPVSGLAGWEEWCPGNAARNKHKNTVQVTEYNIHTATKCCYHSPNVHISCEEKIKLNSQQLSEGLLSFQSQWDRLQSN